MKDTIKAIEAEIASIRYTAGVMISELTLLLVQAKDKAARKRKK